MNMEKNVITQGILGTDIHARPSTEYIKFNQRDKRATCVDLAHPQCQVIQILKNERAFRKLMCNKYLI